MLIGSIALEVSLISHSKTHETMREKIRIKMLGSFDCLGLKILFILKLPLSLAIFFLYNEFLHLCQLKAIATIWDINFMTFVFLKYLKFDNLPVNNFEFNKRFKIQTLPGLLFVPIPLTSTGLILYYTHGETYLKPSEAYQCDIRSTAVVSLIVAIPTFLISFTFALYFSDSTEDIPRKSVLLSRIVANDIKNLYSVLYGRLRLDSEADVWFLFDLFLEGISLVLKYDLSTAQGRSKVHEQVAICP